MSIYQNNDSSFFKKLGSINIASYRLLPRFAVPPVASVRKQLAVYRVVMPLLQWWAKMSSQHPALYLLRCKKLSVFLMFIHIIANSFFFFIAHRMGTAVFCLSVQSSWPFLVFPEIGFMIRAGMNICTICVKINIYSF